MTSPPLPPVAPPRKSKKLVIIVIGVLITAGLAAGVLLLAGNKSDSNGDNNKAQTSEQTDDENQNPAGLSAEVNTQRKNDLAEIIAAFNNYAANNNGVYPSVSNADEQIAPYLGQSLIEPSTNQPYSIQADTPEEFNQIQYSASTRCNDAGDGFVPASSSRAIAFLMLVGNDQFTCMSN